MLTSLGRASLPGPAGERTTLVAMIGLPDVPRRDRARLRAAWAEAVGALPSAFEGEGVTRVHHDDLDSVVVAELELMERHWAVREGGRPTAVAGY